MNNKGFAATGMLYIVLLLFIAMYSSLLIMFANRRKIYDNIKDEIVNGVSNVDESIYNLSDVVSVGDYVAYDAGTWTETKDNPTSQGEFGGYIAGQNKANSVGRCYVEDNIITLKGWRVLSIDKNTNTVTIIHAGQPECYYHGAGYSDASVENINNRAKTQYLNDVYASSAHNMNNGEIDVIAVSNNLRNIGSWYWLANRYDSSYLWYVNKDGNIDHSGNNYSFGVRPVVVLKSNIKTTGKTTDAVGQEAWNLIVS